MRYAVLDLETGCKEVYKRKGNPWHNEIVAWAFKLCNQPLDSSHIYENYNSIYDLSLHFIPGNCSPAYLPLDILVGHNIKYDLLYLWKYEWFQEWLTQGGKIFDTSVAEYLLTGQQHKYPALREIAVNKYGCKSRTKQMEEYWDKGIDTIDIPIELVLQDVESDILDTETVMLKQVRELKSSGLYKLSMEMMEGLLATIEMEYNGMAIARKELQTMEGKIKEELSNQVTELTKLIQDFWPVGESFNIFSNQQLSVLLFGGQIKSRQLVPHLNELGFPVIVKSGKNKGQVKLHYEEIFNKVPGLEIKIREDWKDRKSGKVKVDEKTLKLIYNSITPIMLNRILIKDFLTGLFEIRKTQKILGTYCTGLLELVYTNDSCLHGSINCTGTDTGRTSSSKPNLQNIPN